MSNIRVKVANESFWAFQYPDLPKNQAEINNHPLTEGYEFGDRIEFDDERNIIRVVKTRSEIEKELQQGGAS